MGTKRITEAECESFLPGAIAFADSLVDFRSTRFNSDISTTLKSKKKTEKKEERKKDGRNDKMD